MWAAHASPTLAGIARDTGALALVALDQRIGLRRILTPTDHELVSAETATRFKLDVARTLGPLGSGLVTDLDPSLAELRSLETLNGAGLVLAADRHTQPNPHGPVVDTDLDPTLFDDDLDLTGVDAVKLMVIWRRDEQRGARIELARRFVELAHERGVASILQTLVRPTDAELDAQTWQPEAAMREAAHELSTVGQSLYVTQIPLAGHHAGAQLDDELQVLADAVTGNWVVSSYAVDDGELPDAVVSACRAGASGFLVGEGWWSEVAGRRDHRLALHEVIAPRLRHLGELVDEHARPWAMPHPT